MKRIRWGRVILVLILFMILGIGAYIGQKIFLGGAPLIPIQGETLPDGSPINLPEPPKTPATMSDAERESAIEQARQDAIAAAKATGQSDDNAQKAGEAAATSARKAFYPAQTTGGLGG